MSPDNTGLTIQEQAHVREALRFLRVCWGTWAAVAEALGFGEKTVALVLDGRIVSGLLALRVAQLAGVSVHEVLAGRFPGPTICPHCGHVVDPRQE
jgi:hypothetical protein